MRAIARGSATTELDVQAREWFVRNRKTFAGRVRARGVVSCPARGGEELELNSDPVQLLPIDKTDGRQLAPQFECRRCGHLLLFDAGTVGVAR
jgi:hypothetical protein